MPQMSEPERTRSLPNRHLNLRHEDFIVKASSDFRRRGCFEEQRESLDQVGSRLFNRRTLARDIELWAQCDKSIVFTFDKSR